MADIGIAVVGYGLIGRRHVEAIAATEGVRLSAVVDPDAGKRALAEKAGLRSLSTLEEAFGRDGCQGVILATPTLLHVDQCLAAISAGVPALVEKPIAVKSAEANRVVEESIKTSVPVLVGHHRRHNPLVKAASHAIQGGGIGDIRGIQTSAWFFKPDHYFAEAPWRAKKGAGPLSVNLIHDVDLMRYLCGEVAAVHAVARPARRGFENEDIAAVLLDFENGTVGTMTVSDAVVSPWSWEMTSQEDQNFPQTPEACYRIGGSKGALSIPDMKLWRHKDGAQDWRRPIEAKRIGFDPVDPLVAQIAHFRDVILGNAEPLVSAEEGLRSLAVVEAIETSAATGQRVEVQSKW